jgi:hypothetical protein
MRLSIDFHLDPLEKLMRKLEPDQFQDALEVVGEAGVSLVRRSFAESRSPYDEPWDPIQRYTRYLGDGSKRERFETDKPLVDTRILENSFNYDPQGMSVEIGTPFAWYIYHQGDPSHASKGIMPERAALPTPERGLPISWSNEILESIEAYLEN